MRSPQNHVMWVNMGIMQNQMEKNMEHEMETGIMYRDYEPWSKLLTAGVR